MLFLASTSALIALIAEIAVVDAGCPASCSSATVASCQNTTVQTNLCCFNAPGGLLLQTQFWDTDPASGPSDAWTIHGLWPDNCDGSYGQYCDSSREYTNITQILESYGQTDLLNYMKNYWTDYHGADETFWEHEWGKHGTCINTLNPSCYTDYQRQEEVVDFFLTVVSLYKTLDTYKFLSDANIVPSKDKKYRLSDINEALSAAPGRKGTSAAVLCNGNGELEQVYYTFNVVGSTTDGTFVPVDGGSQSSGCSDQVAYLPKDEGTAYPVSSVTGTAAPTNTLDTSSTCRPKSV